MNPTTPKTGDTTRLGSLDANLVAGCLPSEADTAHWAYGMPLSYVQEMASHWLSLHDQTARMATLVDPNDNRDIPDKGSD